MISVDGLSEASVIAYKGNKIMIDTIANNIISSMVEGFHLVCMAIVNPPYEKARRILIE